jgi:hypothetical protein
MSNFLTPDAAAICGVALIIAALCGAWFIKAAGVPGF